MTAIAITTKNNTMGTTSPENSVCREKPRISSGRDNKPTRELTLHPEPPGGLMEETKSIKHCRKRAARAAQGVLRP